MGKIGIQLYSVRDKTKDNFLDTIRELGKMGYEGVQFAGFFGTPANKLKKVMDESGVRNAGSHMQYITLLGEELKETLEYNHVIGNDLIICPALPTELRESVDSYKKAADTLNEVGRKCVEQGFRFAYHNHNFEFYDLGDGQRGFDILFDNTDINHMKMELDCYWATHGGFDPVEIIKNNKDRVVSLHIKDMARVNGEKRTIEIGEGELDFPELLRVGEDYGVEWFTVEQEHFDRDTLESSRINVKNLKEIMVKI